MKTIMTRKPKPGDATSSIEEEASSCISSCSTQELDLSLLRLSLSQPRKIIRDEELDELTASILAYGVLQPVIVKETNGEFLLVAGQRRFLAAKRAGLRKIPVVFQEGDPDAVALVENLQRSDLSAIEEAEAIKLLKENGRYTIDDISTILGKSRASISEAIRLTKLPEEIRDECRGDMTIAKSILIPIARLKTQDEMKMAYQAFKKKGLPREEVRKMARGFSRRPIRTNLKFVSSFQQRLVNLDIDSMRTKQKETMKMFLVNLHKNVEELIVRLSG